MRADWYFDFISPFSYLQLARLRAWRDRIEITPVPIAFAAVLKHHGQLGPAEIQGKREFTYRFVQWTADAARIALRFPPSHPFNPLAASHLCIAAGTTWEAVERIFDHVWRDGNACSTALDFVGVAAQLGIHDVEAATSDEAVKMKLRANTEAAIGAGVFGVPTLRVDDALFWGNDASPMIDDYLAQPDRFNSPEYRRIANLPVGVSRPR